MPNWCSNSIEVRGKNEDLERFKAAVAGPEGKFDFKVIVPEPVTYEETDNLLPVPGGIEDVFPDWYNWRVAHWGTKWNNTDSDFSETRLAEWYGETQGALTYTFDTAWGPCEEVVAALAAQWPQLHFGHSWDEPGMDFGGYKVYVNGVEETSGSGGSRSFTWANEAENVLDEVDVDVQIVGADEDDH